MATLYIAEFPGIASVGTTLPQVVGTPPIAEQTVAIGGGSTASAAFNTKTKIVRLSTDAICSIAWNNSGAADPVATTANARLPADTIEYFAVQPGGKLAVISNT